LLPAVDVQGGQAVQLVQGIAGSEKTFGDPLAAAMRWQDAGAEWLHLVDLDAAFGRGSNAAVIADIVSAMSLKVELSGGIRDDESLARALATGCRRVNIGTAALENPTWCERIIAEHGDLIGIGLDVRGTKLAARGWVREGGDWAETVDRLSAAGCATFVVTDVQSDGMLTGPNVELLKAVCARTDADVIASGGIAALDDLRALRELVPLGVEGAIIGTALYVGNFTLEEALKVAREG
jgi:phosphoribosylanthranilate isomerase